MSKPKPKEGRPPIPEDCRYCGKPCKSQRELRDHLPNCPKRKDRMTGL